MHIGTPLTLHTSIGTMINKYRQVSASSKLALQIGTVSMAHPSKTASHPGGPAVPPMSSPSWRRTQGPDWKLFRFCPINNFESHSQTICVISWSKSLANNFKVFLQVAIHVEGQEEAQKPQLVKRCGFLKINFIWESWLISMEMRVFHSGVRQQSLSCPGSPLS